MKYIEAHKAKNQNRWKLEKKEPDAENDIECYKQTDEKQMKINVEYEMKTNKSNEELVLLPDNLKK